jgi:hypothetical protein
MTTVCPIRISAASVTAIIVATPQLMGAASASLKSSGRRRIHDWGRM